MEDGGRRKAECGMVRDQMGNAEMGDHGDRTRLRQGYGVARDRWMARNSQQDSETLSSEFIEGKVEIRK
jgi:hypothetical protein